MLRKRPASVVCIDTARSPGTPPEPEPQPPAFKRPFFGNQHTTKSFVGMFRHWVQKVARHYRVPPALIEEQIIEAIRHEQRAA